MSGEPRQATVELERRYQRGGTEVLEQLRRAKAQRGRLAPEDVERVARELRLPRAHVYGAASFYSELGFAPASARTVRVCCGAACFAATGGSHIEALGEELSREPGGGRAEPAYCLGYCYASPSALDGETAHAGPDLVDQLAGRAPRLAPPIPFACASATPVTLARLLGVGPPAWSVYEQVLRDPDAPSRVLAEVERSGLRGRGGAGFPAARKWQLLRESTQGASWVIANGDEGDPGSYVDRLLMERDPHGVLEGVALAALACGAQRGYVYVRSEYPAARDALRAALVEARDGGQLGANIHGSGVGLEIEVFEGAGSYVAGEETALLHSMEGLRGVAAARPPFPAGRGGLYGIPTAVNNVETLSALAWIVANGGEAYAAHGTAGNTGTKLVCLNERFAHPGVYEVEFGIAIAEIYARLGGGLRSGSLRSLQVGGPLGGFLGPDGLETPLTSEALARRGVSLGHGSLVAFDETIEARALQRHLWQFAASESCGGCSPCRIGTRRGLELARASATGEAAQNGSAELERILDTMEQASLCGFGQGLPAAVRGLGRVYADELGRGMNVEVDGRRVELPEGATLFEAAAAAGVELPSLCHDERLSPGGSCRLCLVERGGQTVAACTTPARDGDRVATDDPAALAAVQGTLELIVSQLPARALEPSSELAELCAARGIGSEHFGGGAGRGRDDSHPYVKLDADLCIACGRCVRMCDEVQGSFALELVGRGADTVVGPGSGGPWAESDCVACGGCVDTCPTGALFEPAQLRPAPPSAAVTTTCGYCGVGCTLDVHVVEGRVATITPNRESETNRGHACVKGRFAHGFVHSPERLTRPLLRREGALVPVSWEEALGFLARRLLEIRERFGPDAIAAISSARMTNEENYLVQKLMRTVIGTNNIDNCSRLCHAPSAAGLSASLGVSGGTNPFASADRADCFLVAGANPTEAHPVVGARLKQQVIKGARLVVVDPRETNLARYADVHLRGMPGSNVAVFNGLAHVLLDEGYADEAFLAGHVDGLDELRVVLAEHSPERVEELSGVPASELRRAARLYGAARCASIVYGLGVTEHSHGTDGVRALANLALLTGQVGTPHGGGVNPLRGQNNVQGASDMGALPDLLPGYQRLDDDAALARVEAEWNTNLNRQSGLRILDMFAAALDGRLKALWVIGEDIAQTDPNSGRVEAALAACELVVSQDLFLSRTAERADLVLPAASFLEKDGTFVNFDRRVQRVRPAVAPPGEARTDFEIVNLLAAALGADLGCPSPAAAMDEIARVAPGFGGISHARLDRGGVLHWPCSSPDDPGTPTLHLDGFATPNGRAQLAAVPYLPPGERPDIDYPFVLVTGRRLEHYNSGTMTRRTANLELAPDERLAYPADAARLGVADGALVSIASRRASIEVAAELSERVSPGQVFLSFHFPETQANALTSDANDEFTSCPEYKVTAVRIERARAPATMG